MSVFDDLESAANDIIIKNDFKSCVLYRYVPGGEDDEPVNDGFNAELATGETAIRQIDVAISRSPGKITTSEYIGTTKDTDIQTNDVIELVNPRSKKRRYTVMAFTPTREHTLLELNEVQSGS